MNAQSKARKAMPRIRLVAGRWYAFGGRGERRAVNTALYEAIGFCKRLNARAGRGD